MTLKEALEGRKIEELRKITRLATIADIADMLEELTFPERALYFRLLKTKQHSVIFAALEPEYQQKLVKAFTDDEIHDIIKAVNKDDIVDLIEDMPEALATKILRNVDPERRDGVNKLLGYKDSDTGSIMTVDIISLKENMTVSQAIKVINEEKDQAEISHHFYVTNDFGKLTGRVSLEDLLFNKKSDVLTMFKKATASVTTTTNKEKAAHKFATQDRSSLPVVNKEGELVGIITHDDIIDVIRGAATEDMHRMAGIEAGDGIYSKMSVRKIFKSRILWLLLLMVSATLSQIVLDSFQTIASNVLNDGVKATSSSIIWSTAIVAIMPVISGAAGNAGSQASTTVIRALAIGDITPQEYRTVFWKEFRVSNLAGFTLAVANFARLIIYYAAEGKLGSPDAFHFVALSIAASIALYVVIVLAKVAGGMLPLLAKKMRMDPAVMAAPLLTTLIDALSTLIFFGISIGIMVLVL